MTISLKANSWGRYGQEAPGSITALVRLGTYVPTICLVNKFSSRSLTLHQRIPS